MLDAHHGTALHHLHSFPAQELLHLLFNQQNLVLNRHSLWAPRGEFKGKEDVSPLSSYTFRGWPWAMDVCRRHSNLIKGSHHPIIINDLRIIISIAHV
jgi:hypothetical protein